MILNLATPLQADIKYEVIIPPFKDDCENKTPEIVREVKFHLIKSGEVFINELLFNPKQGGCDYIELYNPNSDELKTDQLFIATRNDSLVLDEVVKISTSKTIRKGDFIVLTTDSINIHTLYPHSGTNCFIEMKKMPAFPDKSGEVVLLNDSLEIVDEVVYSESLHFPLLKEKEGVALERISYLQKSDDPTNWHSASSTVGFGTPGMVNSQCRETVERVEQFYFEPNPFSPNNDGYNDRLTIHLNFQNPEVCSLRIFDIRGRAIRFLANNLLLGSYSKLTWDGLDNEGRKVPVGTYVILAEIYDLNGNRKLFKQAIGVTDRMD